VLVPAAVALALYLALALAGDLRQRPSLFLPAFAALVGTMLVARHAVRQDLRLLRWALVAALLFRLAAALGPPALSDDVHRYVWDGRVQLHGVHPYRHAPAAPALASLRDAEAVRINHPEIETIYPPLAQLCFLGLAALGAGPTGVKLALACVDFGVVLALGSLLHRATLPLDRSILYAWNPLAVLETAGSGHLEPVGILLLLLAGGWIIRGRLGLSTLALAASVQVKLLPLLLVPSLARRVGARHAALLPPLLLLPLLPYALTGPPVGAGLFAYAERWEHNASVYAALAWGLEQIPGDPRALARGIVAALALALALGTARAGTRSFARDALTVLGGALVLSPTLHPWYVLWILPWAAALESRGWLVLAATVAASYAAPPGDVPVAIRLFEFGPPLAVALWQVRTGSRA
jgi:hypothetical protein